MRSVGVCATLCALPTLAFAQVRPRQTLSYSNSSSTTSTYSSSSGSKTGSAPDSLITPPPPCCWIYGGAQAVFVNTWYDTTYTDVVAHETTTFLVYNGTTIIANSTSRRSNATWTAFGMFGPAADFQPDLSIPGIPQTIIPNEFLQDGEYGATSIYLVGGSNAFTGLGQVIASPTPFVIWQDIGFTTVTPQIKPSPTVFPSRWDAAQCGVWQTGNYGAYVNGQWTSTNASYLFPYTGSVGSGYTVESQYIVSSLEIGPAQVTLPQIAIPITTAGELYGINACLSDSNLPNSRIFVDMAPSVWAYGNHASSILSATPWITDCFTIGGEGEPTVHIPVAQVTSTSTHIITMAGPVGTPVTSSTSSPTTSSSTSPTTNPTTSPTTSLATSPTTNPTTSPTTSLATSPTTNPTTSPTTAPTTGPTTGSPTTKISSTPTPTSNSQSPTTATTSANILNPPGPSSLTDTTKQPKFVTSAFSPAIASTATALLPVTSPSSNHDIVSTTTGGSDDGGQSPTTTANAGTQGTTTDVAAGIVGIFTQQVTSANAPAGPTSAANQISSVQVGVAVGSQTAVAGGSAVSQQGTTYSVISSGSAVQVVANGQTSIVNVASGPPVSISGDAALTPVSAAVGSPTAVTVGGSTISYQALGTGSVIIGSTTLAVGSAAVTHNGQTVSLASGSSGAAIVINGQTAAVVHSAVATQAPQIVTANGNTFTVQPASKDGVLVGSVTLSVGGSAAVQNGQTISVASGSAGQVIVVNGQTAAIVLTAAAAQASQVVTGNGNTFTVQPASNNGVIVGSATLSAGGSAVVQNGQTISIASGSAGQVIVLNGQTATTLAAVPAPSTNGSQLLTLGTQVVTAYAAPSSSGAIIIAGQTVVPGSTTVINGETLSLSGSNLVIASGTSTSTRVLSLSAPQQTGSSQVLTLGTNVVTAYAAGSSAIVIGGQTIRPGAVTVIDGETLSLRGTNLVLVSGSKTTTENVAGAIMSGLDAGGSSTSGNARASGSASATTGDVSAATASGGVAAASPSISGASRQGLSVCGLLVGVLAMALVVVLR
ncbi:hypothetical protein LTR62_007993 [Meristemomyces frigidus]|uniref:Uncharacterized protein n=1 Tax=Meristemomyces frigidus TaxID=1508187 RepID=A0AAN7TPH5_9PEZI|nr:hypothetical protein LTR62_007993 [Meristemomyces frigidus]